jgi:hypothetical protein
VRYGFVRRSPVRIAIAILALLAVAARGGCDRDEWDPCAGAACGTACRVCPPDDSQCVETAVVKACDLEQECVAAEPELCAVPAAPPLHQVNPDPMDGIGPPAPLPDERRSPDLGSGLELERGGRPITKHYEITP